MFIVTVRSKLNWSELASNILLVLFKDFFFLLLVNKDEFRRWFLARVRVMLAPGSNPFHSLETQTTSPCTPSSPSCPFSSPATPAVANGHTTQHSDGRPAQELIKRFADYQPVQVSICPEM